MAGFYLNETSLNIARGLVSRTSSVHKFGAVPEMSTNTTGTIWDKNDTLYPWSSFSSASTLTVQTVAAGDNGKKITIIGLDADYNEISEEVTLSSSATVTTTASFIRVYRAYVSSGATNVDDIDVRIGSTTVLMINADKGQTLMSIYTVPDGYTGYLCQGTATVENAGDATIDMFIRYYGQDAFRIGHTAEVTSGGMPYNYTFTVPQKIPSRSDIDIRATVRSNNSRVTAAFDLILVQE